MTATSERRRFPRREISLVTQIASRLSRAACQDGGPNGGGKLSVVTSNIGPGGLLFRTARWREFPVEARVEFALFLPGGFGTENWHCFRLCGTGRVTRHEEANEMLESDWKGIAVSFETPIRLS